MQLYCIGGGSGGGGGGGGRGGLRGEVGLMGERGVGGGGRRCQQLCGRGIRDFVDVHDSKRRNKFKGSADVE